MPIYEYRCACNVTLRPFPIGEAPRTIRCPRCGDTIPLVIGAGVNIAPSALENKGTDVRTANEREAVMDVDRSAYRRMRLAGKQPPHVHGSAELENRVDDQFDIDNGHLYRYAPKETIKEMVEESNLNQLGVG
jgi:hypothetical protein